MMDWLARQPFTRRHPAVVGMLCATGIVVVGIVLLPPFFWLFGGLLAPIGRLLLWWSSVWEHPP